MDRRVAFGRRIKVLREARGLSQEGLAELAHLHRTYIGGIERGERNVSLLNIWHIAEALGVGPEVLFVSPNASDGRPPQSAGTVSKMVGLASPQGGKWKRK